MPTTTVSLKKIKRAGKNGGVRYDWTLRWFQSDGVERSEKIGEPPSMTKREAERIRRHRQAEMEAARVPRDRPKQTTLRQFIDYHQGAIDGKLRPASIDIYRIAAAQLADLVGEDTQICRVDEAAIGRYCRLLRGRGASPATVRKQLTTLRAMFNRAVRWKLIDGNPFNAEPLPRAQPKKKRIYRPDEIGAMIESAKTLWWRVFIQLAATSGLRVQEMLHLQWADIDFEKGTVTVSAKRAGAFTGLDGLEYPIIEWSAKSHQERSVPIPEQAVIALQRLTESARAPVDRRTRIPTPPSSLAPLPHLSKTPRERQPQSTSPPPATTPGECYNLPPEGAASHDDPACVHRPTNRAFVLRWL